MKMLSNKPYFIRAIYNWIVDSDCTPHVMVNADMPRVDVPKNHVQEGRIILNISPMAAINLDISNEALTFGARFSGVKQQIYIPMHAILGVYAMENEEGMFFDPEEITEEMTQDMLQHKTTEATSGKENNKKNKTSHLKLVDD